MSKATYTSTIRSIRDNGMRYTLQHAIDTNNSDALFVCEEISSILRTTDWLEMREQFAKSGGTNHAFRLTTTITKTDTN
jgi:hypothetical protein